MHILSPSFYSPSLFGIVYKSHMLCSFDDIISIQLITQEMPGELPLIAPKHKSSASKSSLQIWISIFFEYREQSFGNHSLNSSIS